MNLRYLGDLHDSAISRCCQRTAVNDMQNNNNKNVPELNDCSSSLADTFNSQVLIPGKESTQRMITTNQ